MKLVLDQQELHELLTKALAEIGIEADIIHFDIDGQSLPLVELGGLIVTVKKK